MALRGPDFSRATLEAHVDRLVRNNVAGLYAAAETEARAHAALNAAIPAIQEFARQYLVTPGGVRTLRINFASWVHANWLRMNTCFSSFRPQRGTKCVGGGALRDASGEAEQNVIAITRLLDVEESIWSPKFGLKGKMDASIVAEVGLGELSNVVLLSL